MKASRRILAGMGGVGAVVAFAGLTWAGTIWLGATEIRDVQVTRVDGGRIFFRTGGAAGTEAARELASVTRLAMDDEPALSAAERESNAEAGSERLGAAAEDYLRALRNTPREWLRG